MVAENIKCIRCQGSKKLRPNRKETNKLCEMHWCINHADGLYDKSTQLKLWLEIYEEAIAIQLEKNRREQ